MKRLPRRKLIQSTGLPSVETRISPGKAENPVVSIIVSARNNGEFLSEAITSALNQTVPCEVIYSDDCSTDQSVSVARSYDDRIGLVCSSQHRGVCAARNAGASIAKCEYLIFLDGDDFLPQDFAEKHLAAIGDSCAPFVYGRAKIVGNHAMAGHIYHIPEWKGYDQWRQNTCNTSCMYDRRVFDACGRWIDDPQTMWDWYLSLRASRYGEPRPSEAVLNYRHHGSSWSDAINERDNSAALKIREKVRRASVRLSILCCYSGRLPGLIQSWASSVARSVKFARIKEPVEIVVLNNAREASLGHKLEDELLKYGEVFSSVQMIRHSEGYSWSTELERRDKVAQFMASASNRLVSLANGDVIWFIEDDIIVPMRACDSMLSVLVSGENPPQAVAGAYRSRHGTNRYIAGEWPPEADHPIEMTQLPDSIKSIGACGTGCLMFWKTRINMPEKFTSHINGSPAHDWAWCHELTRLGGRIVLDPNTVCGHAVTENEIV